MRSFLFVPGDAPRKLEKALSSGADALIIDLEDSVAYADKEAARRTVSAFLNEHAERDAPRLWVRVNDWSSGATDADLSAIMSGAPRGIMLPKAEGGDDVARLGAALRVHEAEHNLADGITRIVPIITETAFGVLQAASYRGCSARLAGLTWGAEDLSADIGAQTARDETGTYTDVFRLARATTLLAAAAAGVAAIDTVYPDFSDDKGFEEDCRRGARDGFVGRMAIHPKQVAPINAAYTPDAESVADARRIVAAFAEAGSKGVVNIDGRMVDRPHLRLAERILARAGEEGGLSSP